MAYDCKADEQVEYRKLVRRAVRLGQLLELDASSFLIKNECDLIRKAIDKIEG